MQCDYLLLRHQEGKILEWPQCFHEVHDNRQFILCCEEWVMRTVFWIVEPRAGELS
jgi:hypothetical protein